MQVWSPNKQGWSNKQNKNERTERTDKMTVLSVRHLSLHRTLATAITMCYSHIIVRFASLSILFYRFRSKITGYCSISLYLREKWSKSLKLSLFRYLRISGFPMVQFSMDSVQRIGRYSAIENDGKFSSKSTANSKHCLNFLVRLTVDHRRVFWLYLSLAADTNSWANDIQKNMHLLVKLSSSAQFLWIAYHGLFVVLMLNATGDFGWFWVFLGVFGDNWLIWSV